MMLDVTFDCSTSNCDCDCVGSRSQHWHCKMKLCAYDFPLTDLKWTIDCGLKGIVSKNILTQSILDNKADDNRGQILICPEGYFQIDRFSSGYRTKRLTILAMQRTGKNFGPSIAKALSTRDCRHNICLCIFSLNILLADLVRPRLLRHHAGILLIQQSNYAITEIYHRTRVMAHKDNRTVFLEFS